MKGGNKIWLKIRLKNWCVSLEYLRKKLNS